MKISGLFITNSICLLVWGTEIPLVGAVLPQPAGWPKFTFQGILTNKAKLKYNPTNEFIFPTVFEAGAYLSNPLDQWYLYYAPHDNPGGICLLHSSSIEGPWTEYANNPVIKNAWPPHYDSVPHVSSPDTQWNPESNRLFVYFHGPNSKTRWAETSDGINFIYGGIAVNVSMSGPTVTESSYARVFPHPNALASGNNYAMFYMTNESGNGNIGKRRIRCAESPDGRVWTVASGYLFDLTTEEHGQASGANFWEWKGQRYVVYHAASGNIYARTIDSTLRNVGTEPILLHKSSGVGDDTGRVASPEFVTKNDETYLFYEAGDRLGATIAWAKVL